MAKFTIHRSETRGFADHGWLKSYHTFSFSSYYNPERMHFGALRVLNDDTIKGSMGFGTHPHENMEIISIPLEGSLEHKDSTGHISVIQKGEVQVMSAGTGIFHSEYNKEKNKEVRLLQIWIFPKKKNVSPRYASDKLPEKILKNQLYALVSPNPLETMAWINQDAWIHWVEMDKGKELLYKNKKSDNGLYVFLINGKACLHGQILNTTDGIGISETDETIVRAEEDATLLIIEVPMLA